jgi:TM2 domain-containing membrane protein YozV
MTLGIMLISLGIIMLSAQLKQLAILNVFITWWPIILVLLGGEILWYTYSSKEPEPKVKYDVFSMFMVFVLAFCSIGMYAVTSTGIMHKAAEAISSHYITVEIPRQSVATGAEVEQIVVRAPSEKVRIESTDSQEAVLLGSATVRATGREQAQELAAGVRLVGHVEGDVLLLSIMPTPRASNMRQGALDQEFTLILPKGKDVKIEGDNYYDMSIASSVLNDLWMVSGRGNLIMNVDRDADLTIEANVDRSDHLAGNIEWNIDSRGEGEMHRSRVTGTLTLGQGQHRILIVEADRVTVNRH